MSMVLPVQQPGLLVEVFPKVGILIYALNSLTLLACRLAHLVGAFQRALSSGP